MTSQGSHVEPGTQVKSMSAILGMACSLPGAPDLRSYWESTTGLAQRTPEELSPQNSQSASDLNASLSSVITNAIADAGMNLAQINFSIRITSTTLTPDDLNGAVGALLQLMPHSQVVWHQDLIAAVQQCAEQCSALGAPAIVAAIETHDNATYSGAAFVLKSAPSAEERVYSYILPSDFGNTNPAVAFATIVEPSRKSAESATPTILEPLLKGAGDCAIDQVWPENGTTYGIAQIEGLVKTILAVYHRMVPITTFAGTKVPRGLYVNSKTRPWLHPSVHAKLPAHSAESIRKNLPASRRAVLLYLLNNSAQRLVLEECPDPYEGSRQSLIGTWETELCIVSGNTPQAIITRLRHLEKFLQTYGAAQPPLELKDVAFSLSRNIATDAYKLSIVTPSISDLLEKVQTTISALTTPDLVAVPSGVYLPNDPFVRSGRTAFILPGLGAAYPNMLAELAMHFPDVRATFDFVDALAYSSGDTVIPSKMIFSSPTAQASTVSTALLASMDSAVVTVLLAEWALFEILSKLGVQPDMLIGCSTGEFAALTISGAIDVIYAAPMFYRLSTAIARSVPKASLANLKSLRVTADYRTIQPLIADLSDVYLSADLSPAQHLLSGGKDSINEVGKRLERAKVEFHPLPMAIPYHTPLVAGVVRADLPEIAAMPISSPGIEMWSCSNSSPYPEDIEQLRKITTELFSHAILFQQTVQSAYGRGVTKFVEVGPKGTLTPIVGEVLSGYPHLAVASNTSTGSAISQIHHMLANLASADVPMDLTVLYSRRAPKFLPIFQNLPPESIIESFVPQSEINGSSATPGSGILRLSEEEHVAINQIADGEVYAPDMVPNAFADGDISIDPTQETNGVIASYLAGMARFHAQMMDVQADVMSAFIESQVNPSDATDSIDQYGFSEILSQPGVTATPAEQTCGGTAAQQGVSNAPGESANVQPAELISRLQASIPSPNDQLAKQELAYLKRARIIAHEHNVVELALSLSLEEDRFLRDHVIGGEVQPGEFVCLLPLTVALEIMAEAATLLRPELVFTGFENIKATRRIRVGPDRCEILVQGKISDDDNSRVSVEMSGYDELGIPVASMSCIAVFEKRYPSVPSVTTKRDVSAHPIKSKSELYAADGIFHGPSMQSLTALSEFSDRTISATCEIRTANDWFASNQSPEWICDPLLMDNATQVVLLHLLQSGEAVTALLPFYAESIRLFQPISKTGSAQIDVQLLRNNSSGTESDITIWQDSTIVAQINKLSHKRISLPASWQAFVDEPHSAFITQAIESTANGDQSIAVINGDHASLDDATVSWFGDYLLSSRERSIFASLRNPRRRKEWLLGRAAAKEAIRRMCDGINAAPFACEIEIEQSDNGRPVASERTLAKLGWFPAISISHKDGTAVALAARAASTVGIDFELITERESGFEKLAFTEKEQEALLKVPPAVRPAAMAKFWCAKEAVGKALGIGMSNNPKSLEIYKPETSADQLVVMRAENANQPGYLVHCLVSSGHVVAVTALELAK